MRSLSAIALVASVGLLALAGCGSEGHVEEPGNATAGKQMFIENCGSCHTLADAGTKGVIGPNLDDAFHSVRVDQHRVTNGKGVMPSFKGNLTPEQIKAVADYVSKNAGG